MMRQRTSVKNPVRWENANFCLKPAHLRKPRVKKRVICERQAPVSRFWASNILEIALV